MKDRKSIFTYPLSPPNTYKASFHATRVCLLRLEIKKGGAKNASFQMTLFFRVYNDLQSIVLIWGKVAIIFSSDCTLLWGLLIYSWIWSQQTHAKIGDSVNWTVIYHRPGTLVYVKSISSFRHHNVLIKVPSPPRAHPGHLTSWHNSTGGGFDNSSWIWQSL